MNREVHVRFWESPEVKVLRATRQTRPRRSPAAVTAILQHRTRMRPAMATVQGQERSSCVGARPVHAEGPQRNIFRCGLGKDFGRGCFLTEETRRIDRPQVKSLIGVLP